jgi:hypothetical protein
MMTVAKNEEKGLMQQGASVNGQKMIITVVGGLFLFTIAASLLTFAIGNYFGKRLDKAALANERNIQTERMKEQESKIAKP